MLKSDIHTESEAHYSTSSPFEMHKHIRNPQQKLFSFMNEWRKGGGVWRDTISFNVGTIFSPYLLNNRAEKQGSHSATSFLSTKFHIIFISYNIHQRVDQQPHSLKKKSLKRKRSVSFAFWFQVPSNSELSPWLQLDGSTRAKNYPSIHSPAIPSTSTFSQILLHRRLTAVQQWTRLYIPMP